MTKLSLPQFHITGQSLQRSLTWSLLAFIVLSIGSRLLQQSGTIVAEVAIVAGIGATIGLVAWQQLAIRRLSRRLQRIEGQLATSQTSAKVKPISPSPVTHFDSEHLFYQGQTKH
jgi:hypothetical protein